MRKQLISLAAVSSERFDGGAHGNGTIESAWHLWHFKVGMESNVAIISTAKRCKHLSTMLLNVCSIFNWPRNVHVVSELHVNNNITQLHLYL